MADKVTCRMNKRGKFAARNLCIVKYDGTCKTCDRRLRFGFEQYPAESVLTTMPALCRCGQLSVIPLRLGFFDDGKSAYVGNYVDGRWVADSQGPAK